MPSHEITGAHTLFALELLLKDPQLAAPAIDEITFLIRSAYCSRLTVGFLVNNFSFVKLDLLSVKIAVACRPFYKCPDLAFYALCRFVEVGISVGLGYHAGIRSFSIILHLVYSTSVSNLRDRLCEELCSRFRKYLRDFSEVPSLYVAGALAYHVSRVEAFSHPHYGDPGLVESLQDCCLHRRSTPEFREQRAMHVYASEPWYIEH